MNKHLILFGVILFALGITSCRKDNLDQLGTFDEGIYQPTFRITSINQGATSVETWSWGTAKLSSILLSQEGTDHVFSYNGDQIGSVLITSPGQEAQTVYYSYGGSKLTKVEVVNGTRTDITMQVNHDANDHITTINLELSDEYLINLAKDMLFTQKSLARLIGEKPTQAIAQAAKTVNAKSNGEKYNITNKHFSLTYTWTDKNITRVVLSGNVTATATIADAADAFNLGTLGSLINMIGADTEFPLSVTVNQTTNLTYDDNNNPLYCLYRDGISPANLCPNNIVTSISTGAADATITITLPESVPVVGGMEYPYNRTIDLSGNESYTYTYNKQKLPETYTTNGLTYTYNYE